MNKMEQHEKKNYVNWQTRVTHLKFLLSLFKWHASMNRKNLVRKFYIHFLSACGGLLGKIPFSYLLP